MDRIHAQVQAVAEEEKPGETSAVAWGHRSLFCLALFFLAGPWDFSLGKHACKLPWFQPSQLLLRAFPSLWETATRWEVLVCGEQDPVLGISPSQVIP